MTVSHNKIGDVVEGVVRSRASFGVFVELESGAIALLEIFQIYDDSSVVVNKTNMPQLGQRIKAVIVGKRISGQLELSVKRQDFDLFGCIAEWIDWRG